MHIEDYISNDFEKLQLGNTIKHAQERTKNHNISHFPVVENNKFHGSISERDLQTFEEDLKHISDYQYLFELFFATKEHTIIDLLTLCAIHETNTIPFLNKKKEYIGNLELSDVLTLYAEAPFLKDEGIILILEKENSGFSMSEITQIIETNNSELLGLYVSKKKEQSTQITIKIKAENINEIIQSYRRYEYNIISNHEDDSYMEDLNNRSNYLLRYLSI